MNDPLTIHRVAYTIIKGLCFYKIWFIHLKCFHRIAIFVLQKNKMYKTNYTCNRRCICNLPPLTHLHRSTPIISLASHSLHTSQYFCTEKKKPFSYEYIYTWQTHFHIISFVEFYSNAYLNEYNVMLCVMCMCICVCKCMCVYVLCLVRCIEKFYRMFYIKSSHKLY